MHYAAGRNRPQSGCPFSQSALAGFTVLSVVETGARHIMASDAAVPNVGRAMLLESNVATAPAGLLLLRPGKGQGGRHVTDLVIDRDAPMRSRSMRPTTIGSFRPSTTCGA